MKFTSKLLVGTLLTLGAFSANATEQAVFADTGYTDSTSANYVPWQDYKNHPEDVRPFELIYGRVPVGLNPPADDYVMTDTQFAKADYSKLSNWDKIRYNNKVFDNSMVSEKISLTKTKWTVTDQSAIDAAEKRLLELADQGYPFAKYIQIKIITGKELKTCESTKSPARCRRDISLNDDVIKLYDEVMNYDVTYRIVNEYTQYLQRFSRKNSNAKDLKKQIELKYLPIFRERRELLRNMLLDSKQGK